MGILDDIFGSGDPLEDEAEALGIDVDVLRQQRAQQAQDEADRQRRERQLFEMSQNKFLGRRQEEIENAKQAALDRDYQRASGAHIDKSELERVYGISADESKIRGDSAFMEDRASNIAALQAAAEGRGPSLTQETLRRGQEQAQNRMQSLMLSQRGGANAAQSSRDIALGLSELNNNAMRDAGALGLQEQMGARTLATQALSDAIQQDAALRGQDIGLQTTQAELELQQALANQAQSERRAQANAGFAQQTSLANQAASLTNQAQKDAYLNQLLGMGMQAEENQANRNAQSAMGAEQLTAGDSRQTQSEAAQRQMGEDQGDVTPKDWASLGMNVGGKMLEGAVALGTTPAATAATAASDRRVKKDISKVDDRALDDMFDELQAYGYEYKEGMGLPKGRHVGVMAQDLKKSRLGDQLVTDVDGVLTVDYAKALPMMMAEIVNLRDDIIALTGNKSKK